MTALPMATSKGSVAMPRPIRTSPSSVRGLFIFIERYPLFAPDSGGELTLPLERARHDLFEIVVLRRPPERLADPRGACYQGRWIARAARRFPLRNGAAGD